MDGGLGSYAEVRDQLTIPDLVAARQFWADAPPISWVARGLASIKPAQTMTSDNAPGDFTGLGAVFGILPVTKSEQQWPTTE